ncbi:hypothetical protein [Jiulongibacter sp. NS-SX5]|uniref:hypothetical protein n=1 Tax=Jiulongibacter sp. NS-SX5 TaxID=3463854 RepID=UPI0040593D31
MKSHLLALFTLIALNTFGQSDFKPGIIIQNNGDTLRGEIDNRGDIFLTTTCRFNNGSETIDYNAYDIKAFQLFDGKYYVSKELGELKVFMEYIVKGELDLYYLRNIEGDHYYLEKEGLGLMEMTYYEEIRYKGDNSYLYKSNDHMRLLTYFMQDAKQLQPKIERIDKPDRKKLTLLAEEYHNLVCKTGEECIIYKKPKNAIRLNIDLLSGMIKFPAAENLNQEYYYQGGAILNFCLPRVNDRVYLRTGLLYSQPIQNGIQKRHYKVPLHIGYIGPKSHFIRPTASIGLLSPSYSAGLSFKISNHVSLGLQGWANFSYDAFPIIPEKLLNYSLLGALSFDFSKD